MSRASSTLPRAPHTGAATSGDDVDDIEDDIEDKGLMSEGSWPLLAGMEADAPSPFASPSSSSSVVAAAFTARRSGA